MTQPGVAYHVLNRRVTRLPLFAKAQDYLAVERVPAESVERPDASVMETGGKVTGRRSGL